MIRVALLLTAQICVCASAISKCCPASSVLTKTLSGYDCTERASLRTAIITNTVNVIRNLGDTETCVEVDEDGTIGEFRIKNDQIIKESSLDVDFFPKCCPVGFYYNSTTQGCAKPRIAPTLFFDELYVKVGLLDCDIISEESLAVSLARARRTYEKGRYCVDENHKGTLVVRVCHRNYDICSKIRCIRKCCPDGQSFIDGANCGDTFVHGLDFSNFTGHMDKVEGPFAVVHGFNKPVYLLNTSQFNFYLDYYGVFTQKEIEARLTNVKVDKSYTVEEEAYCVEHAVKKGRNVNEYCFFRGFPKEKPFLVRFYYTRVAMITSCIFLILTILYYISSDEKNTVFGKTLISYCTVALVLYMILVYVAFLDKVPSGLPCDIIAFVVFYATLSIFTWMNVMCIDIYWTFGSSKSFVTRQHRKALKRFLMYSLYGWGLPLVLTALPLIFRHVDVLPEPLDIIVDNQKCLLKKGDGYYATTLFSTTPVALQQLCNLILFIRTAIYCLKVKKEISKMNDTNVTKSEKSQKFDGFKQRFGLLLKLFVIMGMSFMFEVVSEFCSFKENEVTAIIEIVWDVFNCLQGLFIFLIFVAKKRIFKKCQTQIGLNKLRKLSMVSSAMASGLTSGATQTTSLAPQRQ